MYFSFTKYIIDKKIPYMYNFLEANLCGDQFIIYCSKIKYTPSRGKEIRGRRFYLQYIMKKGFAIKKIIYMRNFKLFLEFLILFCFVQTTFKNNTYGEFYVYIIIFIANNYRFYHKTVLLL